MKKLISLLLALTLMMSIGVTAFASDLDFKSHDYTQGDQEPMTQLIWTEKKGASWTLNIPAEFQLPYQNTVLPLVTITNVQNLGESQRILALVGGNGEYLVRKGSGTGSASMAYKIQIYEWTEERHLVEEFDPTDTSRMGVVAKYERDELIPYGIVIAIDENHWNSATPSGRYESTLIYTSLLENIE